MTVGIGTLCEDGRCVILGSDMRASYPGGLSVHPNDLVGKQYHFSHIPRFENVSCAIAGRLSLCTDVAFSIASHFARLSKKKRIFHEHIHRAINGARSHVLLAAYDWRLRAHLSLTWNQLHRGEVPKGTLVSQAIANARAICDAYQFKVELIVAGFVDGEPVLFRASGKEELQSETSPGIYVIGSYGARAAMNHLNKRGQTLMRGLPSSLLHVHEAMEAARKVDKEHIGPPAIYAVISYDRGLGRFDPRSPLLRGWTKAYKNRKNTWSLDTQLAKDQMRAQLFKWQGHDGSRVSDFGK